MARRIVLGLLHLTEPNWISRTYFSTELGTRGQSFAFLSCCGCLELSFGCLNSFVRSKLVAGGHIARRIVLGLLHLAEPN